MIIMPGSSPQPLPPPPVGDLFDGVRYLRLLREALREYIKHEEFSDTDLDALMNLYAEVCKKIREATK